MGDTPQLGYRPELDGLRALAVGLVLVFHADVGVFRAGYVGVSVFFTLSGYLITRLLLDEHARTGRVDLRRFWTRRARRLLPASATCVVGVVAAAGLGLLPTDGLRRDVLASVVQVFNWSELSGSHTYADLLAGRAGPLDHFWSLSIEEQFYWVWPLVVGVAARLGRVRPAIVGLAVGAWAAAPLIASTFGGDAAYWATPARAGEILTGAVLALVATRPASAAGRHEPLVAWAGLATIVVVALVWPTASGPAYDGWFPVFSLATAAVIWGTRNGAGAARWLAHRHAVAVGRVSYGLYLYHWPIYLIIDAERLGAGGATLLIVRVATTAVVAALSYRIIEQPIRSGEVRMPAVSVGLACAVVAAVLVAGSLTTAGGRFELAVAPQRAAAVAPPTPTTTTPVTSAPTTTPPETTTPVTATPVTATPATVPAATLPVIRTTSTPDQTAERRLMSAALRGPLPLPARDDALRVLVVGDSTAWAVADGLFAWSEANPARIDVTLLAAPGCSWGTGELVDPLAEQFKTACDEYLDDTLEPTIADWLPEVVVVMTTFADLEEWVWSETEGILVPPSAAFAAHLAGDYADFVARLRAAGAGRIVWVTGPRVMHSAHSDLGGPGEPGRMEMQHDVVEALAAADPDLSVLDLNTWYLASEYGPDDSGRSDRLHLDVPVAYDIADRLVVPWLVEIARLEDGTTDG